MAASEQQPGHMEHPANAEAIRQFYVTMDDETLHAHLIAAGIEHMNRRGSADGIGGIEYGMRAVRQLMGMMRRQGTG